MRFWVKANLAATEHPVNLVIEGRATVNQQTLVREAVPAEDYMQAFLWRHLVPAEELKVLVYDPADQPSLKRVRRPSKKPVVQTKSPEDGKPKFSKRQVAGRLRQLERLFEEGLLTDKFYNEKVAECEAAV